MPDRITLTSDTYMQLDGQWQVVLRGSVIDVPSHAPFQAVATKETEGASPLASHGKPTGVRNLRTQR